MAFVGILSQINLLFVPLVTQLVRYILKQLFTSVSVKVVNNCSLNPLPKILSKATLLAFTEDLIKRDQQFDLLF